MLNLLNFVKKILPSYEKNELLLNLEISLKQFKNIREVYSNLQEVLRVTKFNSKRNKDILDKFYKELKEDKISVKLSPSKNLGEDILNIFKNIENNGKLLYRKIDDDLNDIIISEAISNLKAIYLRSIAHYEFMTTYALKFANYLYITEIVDMNLEVENNYKLNKKQIEYIEKNIWIFARLIASYSVSTDKLEKEFAELEDIVIIKDKTEEIEELHKSNKIDFINDLPANFIGSPIYSIRLAIATWQAERYKAMKDEKKLLELRHLHYKMLKENGNSDPAIEKEIGYLQKKITDLDYKISKMEESIND